MVYTTHSLIIDVEHLVRGILNRYSDWFVMVFMTRQWLFNFCWQFPEITQVCFCAESSELITWRLLQEWEWPYFESLWVQGQLQGHKTEVRFGVVEDRMRMSLSDTGWLRLDINKALLREWQRTPLVKRWGSSEGSPQTKLQDTEGRDIKEALQRVSYWWSDDVTAGNC